MEIENVREEKYQPKLNWAQDEDAAHIYRCTVDGKHAGTVAKGTLAGNVPVWFWSAGSSYTFGRQSPSAIDRGHETTARLAVQKVEEFFNIIIEQPVFTPRSLEGFVSERPTYHRGRRYTP